MKKVLVFCCVVLLVMSMSVSALAIPGGFVSSPSSNQAPSIVDFEVADPNCSAQLTVVPFSSREELPVMVLTLIEQAYDSIRDTVDFAELSDELAKLAAKNDIDTKDLAVSDLFTLSAGGCEHHDGHEGYDIKLSSDALKNFVALMYMDDKGEWQIVENARVEEGDRLVFSMDVLYPLAVVVESEGATQTGETDRTWLYLSIMAVSAAAMLIVWRTSKKQTA